MNENLDARQVIGIGETILDIIFKENKVENAVPGGSTFNSLISLGRCNTKAMLLSEVGDDKAGEYILDFMKANNVDTSYMLLSHDIQTPLSLAFLDEKNDATYSFYKSLPSEMPDMPFPEVKEDDVVLFGSFFAIDFKSRERVKSFLEYAKDKGAILFYDVNYREAHKGELVRLMPNIIENLEYADIVRGSKSDFDIIYNIPEAEKLYSAEVSFYTQNLIYTDSNNPVSVFGEGDFKKEYPTERHPTLSTIGAGDSFNAGFIYALLKCGITRENILEGLLPLQWDELIATAQTFSADCCGSMFNYVSEEFASKL